MREGTRVGRQRQETTIVVVIAVVIIFDLGLTYQGEYYFDTLLGDKL